MTTAQTAAPRRARKKAATAAPAELAARAAHNTLAANPLVGVRRKEVLATASTLLAPSRAAAGRGIAAIREVPGRAAAGRQRPLRPRAGGR